MEQTVKIILKLIEVLEQFKEHLLTQELNKNHEMDLLSHQLFKDIINKHADELGRLEEIIKNHTHLYEKNIIEMTTEIEKLFDSIKKKQGLQ